MGFIIGVIVALFILSFMIKKLRYAPRIILSKLSKTMFYFNMIVIVFFSGFMSASLLIGMFPEKSMVMFILIGFAIGIVVYSIIHVLGRSNDYPVSSYVINVIFGITDGVLIGKLITMFQASKGDLSGTVTFAIYALSIIVCVVISMGEQFAFHDYNII